MQKDTTLAFALLLVYNNGMDSYYIKNPLTAQFSVKSIYTIHYFKYGRNFRFPKEKHDFWEMIYVDGGWLVN